MSKIEGTIYVGNLPNNTSSRKMEELFDKYGKINDVDVKVPRAGPSYCFIEFDDDRDAVDAVRGRNGYEFGPGNRLKVELHRTGPGRGRGRGGFAGRGRGRGGGGGGPPRRSDFRVMVSNLPPTGSWQDIKDHMREAGDVTYADVFRDGVGVVEFTRKEDMDWAVKNLDDSKFKSHEGETAHIRVKPEGMSSNASASASRRSPPPRSPPPQRDGRGGGGGGGGRRRGRTPSRSRSRSSSRSSSSSSRSRTPPPRR